MASYRRIESATDLIAGEKEGEVLDFKGSRDPTKWWKLAKDVAAFANHLGGVVLVGAIEQPDGTATYGGLPEPLAKKISDAYELTALQKCVPRQTVHPKMFAVPTGNFMVAVNVESSPVFVAAEYPTTGETSSGSTAWRFPLRCGRYSDYLSPELLPMFLDPKTRRSSVLLNQLEGKNLWVLTQHESLLSTVKGADLKKNQVHLEVRPNPPGHTFQAYLPFDDVEAVWEGDGGWYARLSGYFESDRYQPRRLLPYKPPFPE
jgi:hypothetical protein